MRVKITANNVVCVDGVPVGRVVDGQFVVCDRDRYRSAQRGTDIVVVPLCELSAAIAAHNASRGEKTAPQLLYK